MTAKSLQFFAGFILKENFFLENLIMVPESPTKQNVKCGQTSMRGQLLQDFQSAMSNTLEE
jgi:hypothetical protein